MKEEELSRLQKEAKRLVQIDLLNLHEDWANQPYLYQRYGEILAEIEKEKNNIRAELDRNYREELLHKLGKLPSEAAVQSLVENNEEYIKIIYQCSILGGIVKSFDHKKKALENEVQLVLGGYFSMPISPKSMNDWKWGEGIDVFTEKQRNGINKKGGEIKKERK